ncbi:TKL protein kinase [Saprolegnia diclina VS20]|uniref:TKL protein kinase n=1 Tax=Saprolegnia diclina (strain VS20) TaxID=1156394 RepID=T0QHG6_SAPDV|nr:TKL protein kinase [Saprolegnia diclina VS20]EQC33105.1 TKL protein kinase [Saprolegnia diclina VS20]|eukprot:XP_008613228.1 TKL protein kinase [Saprolegnia diclina VS20]
MGVGSCAAMGNPPDLAILTIGTGGYCSQGMICVLNATCQATLEEPDTRASFGSITQIGALTNYRNPSLRVRFSPKVLRDTSKLLWPAGLVTLELSYNELTEIPSSMTWPLALQSLNLMVNNLTTLPTNLPATILSLDLQSNLMKSLANADLSHLESFATNGNPVTSIVNVTFSPKLKTFDCGSSQGTVAITNFIVSPSTFKALNGLNKSCSVLPIASDAALCAKANGALQTIWTNNTICVYSDATPAPTAATINDATSNGSSSNTGTIVGVVVGVVVLVLLALGAYCYCRRRKQAHENVTTTVEAPYSHASATPRTATGSQDQTFNLQELATHRLDATEVVIKDKIATGAFGEVWRAEYKHKTVAVKMLLHTRSSAVDVQGLVDEIKLLAQFDSPHIVSLIGATWTTPSSIRCVLEYMNMGDLRDYLANHKPNEFSWSAKISCIHSIVYALVYLHSMQIIHRDLKSRNVLLDSAKGTKLTDFGVSKEDTHETMTVGVGTYRWMAPEILQFNHYTVAADIFSFGMLLSEFDSHQIPYAGVINEKNGKPLVDTAIMGMVIAGSLKPTFSAKMPSWLRDVATQCVASEPNDRPTAYKLAHIFRDHVQESL